MPPEWESSQHQPTYGSGTGSPLTPGAAAAGVPPVGGIARKPLLILTYTNIIFNL